MSEGSSKAVNAVALETSKRTTAKAAAATIKTALDVAVALDTKAGFSTAKDKAEALVKAYGELAGNRLP